MHSTIHPGNSEAGASALMHSQSAMRQLMSSREIADLTGSTHDNVLKTVRLLIRKGVVSTNETPYKHPQNGQAYPEFLLDYRDSMVVVSGYSVELRARIIDRWQALEELEAARHRIPTTFAEALQVAADQAKKNLQLQQVIQEQAPKVAALQRLAKTPGSVSLTDAAKHLGMGPLKLITWLHAHRWIYRRSPSANWSAYQPRITGGLLEHKMVRVNRNETEELKIVEQVMVTRRGLVVLAEKVTGLSPAGKV